MTESRASRRSKTLGVLLIVVGIVAMIVPFFAAQTMIRLLGWLLILAAIEQGVEAYQSRGEGGLFLKVFLAVLYAFVAFLLLGRPAGGDAVAIVIIAMLFLLDGITEIALALRTRREGARSEWLFAGGAISFLFGAIILYTFPTDSVWIVGLLVGIRLIVKGIEQITSSLPRARPGADRPSDLSRAA